MNSVTRKPSLGAGRFSKSMYGVCSVTAYHSSFAFSGPGHSPSEPNSAATNAPERGQNLHVDCLVSRSSSTESRRAKAGTAAPALPLRVASEHRKWTSLLERTETSDQRDALLDECFRARKRRRDASRLDDCSHAKIPPRLAIALATR
jgi:hypothetical protein